VRDVRCHGVVLWTTLSLLGGGADLGCGGSVAGNAGPDASLRTPDASVANDDANAPAMDDADAMGPLFPPPDGASLTSCPPGSPLSCYVDTNCGGSPTTITGTVYDPAGRNPINNAVVFVPNDPTKLPAIPTGVRSCNLCNVSIGDYVTVATTDPAGRFTLKGVPTGDNVPLVIQVGKWRRMISVPMTRDCATVTLAAGTARLPRNRAEGNLPQMALLTGGCDNMACFLRSVGIDASEFTSPNAGGRIDVYQGLGATGTGAPLSNGAAGDCTTGNCPLWSSTASLAAYDEVLLGCECSENNQTKPASSLMAMYDYLHQGGILFATHSQATWFKNGPADFQAIATWTDGPTSGATGPFAVDTTFQAGNNFRAWLIDVDAGNAAGIIPLTAADVSTSVTTVPLYTTTTRWIYDESPLPDGGGAISGNVKALSYRAPLPADAGPQDTISTYCGTAYFTDIHAAGGQALEDTSGNPGAVPAACDGGPMTAEEKALEFLFFDPASCPQQGPGKVGPPGI
jgi:hypothetical protein